MINNRQGGRRRGRGGQRPQGMPGNAGNRQDNRQRGNAAQLLEKYKTLARDAQLAGDRVQTEYYLQYADHYFRVLEENRSRFEEQNQRRRRDEDEDEVEGDEELTGESDSADDDGEVEARPRERRDRGQDRGRERGRDRYERRDRDQFRGNGAERGEQVADTEQEGDERIPLAVLPPSIGAGAEESDDVAAKPRRRTRKPRAAEGDDEVAPAA